MSNNFRLGQVVQSTMGHDKGMYYLVVGLEENRIWVGDGKYKLLSKLKAKNPSHLIGLDFLDTEISTKLEHGQKINDQMIYHALLKFKKSNKE